jgi:hypothetical protein
LFSEEYIGSRFDISLEATIPTTIQTGKLTDTQRRSTSLLSNACPKKFQAVEPYVDGSTELIECRRQATPGNPVVVRPIRIRALLFYCAGRPFRVIMLYLKIATTQTNNHHEEHLHANDHRVSVNDGACKHEDIPII